MKLPPSGVSRAVFGARHDSHQEDIVFMLLRGVGPHSHPRTESSGVVWGRPSPPALDSSRRGAMCRSRRGACRGRRCPLEPWPPVDRAPRSNSPAPAGCCASKSTNAERSMAVRLARTGAGPVVLVLRGPLSMARAVWSSRAGREHSVLPSPGRGRRPRRIGDVIWSPGHPSQGAGGARPERRGRG